MERDFNKELEKIDQFIDNITSVADSDGKITSDEQNLMDEIMSDLSDYRLLVLEALEDGRVDDNESADMKEALDNIVTNASKMAISDGQLSDDEQLLIDSLIEFAS